MHLYRAITVSATVASAMVDPIPLSTTAAMPGEELALIGPSSSGKTTILRILMTLDLRRDNEAASAASHQNCRATRIDQRGNINGEQLYHTERNGICTNVG